MKPVVASTAYLLISHGSRDPRPQEAMNQLAELVRQQLDEALLAEVAENAAPNMLESIKSGGNFSYARSVRNSVEGTALEMSSTGSSTVSSPASSSRMMPVLDWPHTHLQVAEQKSTQKKDADYSGSGVIVGTACLELSVLSLREQICEFGSRLIAAGVTELKLLPVFLMAGVHVMEDIPAEIDAARQQLGKDIQLTVCDHLGSHPNISAVLRQRLTSVPAESSILVAHGSRRHKGNRGIERLSKLLDVQVAYWAVPPDIETQVIELMQQGCQKLTILPYFLFAGGITDAIAHRTEELAERFPKVQFRLLPTLGATAEMAQLSVEMIRFS